MALAEVVPNVRTYERDGVLLLPYVDGNGSWPEEFLVKAYLQAKADNVVDIVFPGMEMTLSSFVSFLRERAVIVGVDSSDYNVLGLAWLNECEGKPPLRKASFGFLFWKQYWGSSKIRTFSRLGLEWWFTELKIDALFGFTLDSNTLAQAFSRELGFRTVANIPSFFPYKGELHGARCVLMTKEEFQRAGTE